jgi:mannose-1-phosphate guanylyltransferase
MKAVILCGGLGTRLSSITNGGPKALIDVQGRTVTEHIFDLLKRHGINEVILAVGYKADLIMHRYGDGSGFGLKISYAMENEPLGTAGPLRIVKSALNGTFLVSNGDELKDIDLDAMLRFHKGHGGLATMALTPVADTTQYGIVESMGGRISRFVEKPRKEDAPSNLANAGIYMMEPGIIEMIPEGFSMLEKSVFPQLASRGKLYGFPFSGQWFDTGTPERYWKACREWKYIR